MTDAHRLNDEAVKGSGEGPDPLTDAGVLEALTKARGQMDVGWAVLLEMYGAGDYRMAAVAAQDIGAAAMATRDLLFHFCVHRKVGPGSMEEALRAYVDLARRHDPSLFPPDLTDEMFEEARRHDLTHEIADRAAEAIADLLNRDEPVVVEHDHHVPEP